MDDEHLYKIITEELHFDYPNSNITLPFTSRDYAWAKTLVGIPEDKLEEVIYDAYDSDIRDARYDMIAYAIQTAFPKEEGVSWQTLSDELQESLLDYVQTAFCIEPPYDQIISTVNTEKGKVSC